MKKILHYFTCLVVAITFTSVVTFSDWVIPAQKAEANQLAGFATELTTLANGAIQATIAGSSAANATANIANFARENVLDGLAWSIAKQIVSSMVRSLINWVNSGFQGSPAFIQDLKQHLLGILDQAAGQFIESLGGIGEFICSPFRLDVQAALSVNYAKARSNMPSGPTEGMCTLSGIGSNIENFLSGTVESMDQWLEVTGNPQNTPLGAYLEAEAHMNIALRNAAGQEIEVLKFNEGFLSKKICEGLNGQPGKEGQNCKITTPGKIIADQLNKSLGAGQDALIQADEINELIGALLNQLVMKALEGINGLLGLGGNSSYTDPTIANGSDSYLDAMVKEAEMIGIDGSTICSLIDDQGKVENDFIQIIDHVSSTSTVPATNATADEIDAVLADATRFEPLASDNLQILNEFANRLTNPENYTTATRTPDMITNEVIVQYSQVQQIGNLFTSQVNVDTKRTIWAQTFPSLNTFTPNPELPWGECKAKVLSLDNTITTSIETTPFNYFNFDHITISDGPHHDYNDYTLVNNILPNEIISTSTLTNKATCLADMEELTKRMKNDTNESIYFAFTDAVTNILRMFDISKNASADNVELDRDALLVLKKNHCRNGPCNYTYASP